jgi:hypothetical protein
LVIEEFDWDNEWADSSYVQSQGARGCDCGEDENGLTWELVELWGVSSSLQGQNLLRNDNKRARVSHSRFEEDFGSANEEEEDQDPHDDVDVMILKMHMMMLMEKTLTLLQMSSKMDIDSLRIG